jgi:NAD(P)-dependent dehydrogenase (short-subunit alcohol dehydrogenase family)
MTDDFGGRVVVVTGGNRGIGRSIAHAFARAGAAVAIGARDETALSHVVGELDAAGEDCLAAPCDVADPASVDAFGEAVLGRFGRVDVVVACAGIAGPTKPLHLIEPEEWRECLAIDLDGVYLTFRRFLPGMIDRRSGSLIAITSVNGKRPLYGRTPYAAAKLGLVGLVRTLALELGPYGVRANAVCPGAVGGERIERVLRLQAEAAGITVEEVRRQAMELAPLRRFVEADEVADACVYLASERAAAITGEELNVSAGLVMH